jgi:hypothetical protein
VLPTPGKCGVLTYCEKKEPAGEVGKHERRRGIAIGLPSGSNQWDCYRREQEAADSHDESSNAAPREFGRGFDSFAM